MLIMQIRIIQMVVKEAWVILLRIIMKRLWIGLGFLPRVVIPLVLYPLMEWLEPHLLSILTRITFL